MSLTFQERIDNFKRKVTEVMSLDELYEWAKENKDRQFLSLDARRCPIAGFFSDKTGYEVGASSKYVHLREAIVQSMVPLTLEFTSIVNRVDHGEQHIVKGSDIMEFIGYIREGLL